MDPYGEGGGGGKVILAPLLSAENRNTDHNPCYVVGNPLAVFKVGGGGDFSSIA